MTFPPTSTTSPPSFSSLLLLLSRLIPLPFRSPTLPPAYPLPLAARLFTMPRRSARNNASSTIPANLISIGRVTKPNRRRLAATKKSALSPSASSKKQLIELDSVPTSPVSSQDSVASDTDLPLSHLNQPSNLALGFEPQGSIIGREEESHQLTQLLSDALSTDKPTRPIYICGTPGTGKTFTVSKVTKRLRSKSLPQPDDCIQQEESESTLQAEHSTFNQVWVNCVNLNQPKDLFAHLVTQLNISTHQTNPKDAIRDYAASQGSKTLIILDEVDFLTSRDQMVLYSAFEWPRIPNSRLLVVGIANSIDLPVRLLPWLRASGCMPHILPFTPYNSNTLQSIVEQRLNATGQLEANLDRIAISLAAKKVAAGSGDARLMLDVCREAQAEINRGEKSTSCIAVVSSIINRRGGLSAAVETIRQLPVQQQLALCVAANAVTFSSDMGARKGKLIKKATLGGLYESFGRMCSRVHVSCLSFPEFADIFCNALMHHGLVDVPSKVSGKGAKTLRGKAVRLRVPIEDVRAGVAEKGFLPLLIAQ